MKRIFIVLLMIFLTFPLCFIVFADEESAPTDRELPEGYDDTQCGDSFDNEKLWRSKWNEHSFDGEFYDKENGIFYADWIHQVWDDEHKQLYLQERYDMTVSMQKIQSQRGEWLDDVWYSIEVADCIGYYKSLDEINMLDEQSRMELKVDGYDAVYIYSEGRDPGNSNGVLPYSWNHGKVYVQIGDYPNCYGKVSMLVIACTIDGYNFDIYDSMFADYISQIKSLPCKIDVKKEEQVFKEIDTGKESETKDPGYVKYSGRLTYTNGAVNKYGQPWPDLMDFDGDGDIDYADRQIQHVLVHNPDALDTPEGAMLVITAVIVAIAGAGGSAFAVLSGGIGSGISGSGIRLDFSGEENEDSSDTETKKETEKTPDPGPNDDLGPYISRDADGDLNVRDPASGENRLYKANGDGTYTNPLTGATYTEEELKDSLESRAENASLIRKDDAARDAAIYDQRDENEKRSQFGIDIEKQAQEELERQNAVIEHESYVEGLELKYGEEGKELKKAIMTEQINAEVEGNRQMAKEAYLEAGQKTAESTEKAADVAIDVLAEVTGEEGKAIKDAYTFTKSTLAKGAEAYAEGRSVTQGMVHGAVEGAVSVGQNHADGAANKFAANVGGDMFKTALDATAKGEEVDFAKVAESGGMAALNTAVDVGFDAAGEVVKGVADLGDDTAATVFRTAVSSESAADAAKAGLSDLTKEGVEKFVKTDDD